MGFRSLPLLNESGRLLMISRLDQQNRMALNSREARIGHIMTLHVILAHTYIMWGNAGLGSDGSRQPAVE